MKLCPLFESIQIPHKQRLEPPASFYDGLVAANRVLPREAIESAIDIMQSEANAVTYLRGPLVASPLLKHIEQLRAMLPHDAADLTGADSELHGGGG
jgi:hypothetical protein